MHISLSLPMVLMDPGLYHRQVRWGVELETKDLPAPSMSYVISTKEQ